MNKNVKNAIEYLKCWRESFMADSDFSFYKKVGIETVIDDLSGIAEDGHNCYASYLFSKLSEDDKKLINRELPFYVDFENLCAEYDIE